MNRSNMYASMDALHVISDIVEQLLVFIFTMAVWGQNIQEGEKSSIYSMFLIFLFIFIVSNRAANIYNSTLFFYIDRIIKKETLSFLWAGLAGGLIYFWCLDKSVPAQILIHFLVNSYILILFGILVFRNVMDIVVNRKHVPRCVYVGSKKSYDKFRYFMQKTTIRMNEIGYVSLEEDDDAIEYIGTVSDLEQIIRKYNIDFVYMIQHKEQDIIFIQKYIDLCNEMGITCRVIIDMYNKRKAYSYNSSIGTYPVITYHTVSMNNWESIVKRTFDIVFSLIGIIITSPIMIITAIAIKIDSPGPAIFKQVRIGKNGRHFKIWKFRSMYQDAEQRKEDLMQQNEIQDGMMFKIKNDPRITRVGKFIRKMSIDELPQFFIVLSGSMSFVGSRPPTTDEIEKYKTNQWRRISIKPGITGMWQVNGRSNIKNFDDVVRLDVEYIDNWTLGLDLKILLQTVKVVLKHDNAY